MTSQLETWMHGNSSSSYCLSDPSTSKAVANKQDKLVILISCTVDIAEGRLCDMFHQSHSRC